MPHGDLAPMDSVRKCMKRMRPVLAVAERCFLTLVHVNCWRSAERNWGNLCKVALEQGGLSPVSRLELLVRAGISQWINADRAGLADTLTQASAAYDVIGPTASKEVKNSR